MDNPSSLEHYIFDATALIYLERGRSLSVLDSLGMRIRIPNRVARETNKPHTPLADWLRRNPNNVVRDFLPNEGALYLRLIGEKLGDGEAAAIAIASERGWTLVTDDGAAARRARSLRINVLNIQEFLARPLL